jgi:hypothetical protein
MVGYYEDGPNLVTMAMNGWGDGAAAGATRSRPWAHWRAIDANLDAYATLRSSDTAVVILEP